MAETDAPRPPYVLLFEEVVPGATPLAVMMDDRAAVPLFDSEAKAQAFLASFGQNFEPVEVSRSGLIRALESVDDEVGYVALNPPPATGGGMKVRMGDLRELVTILKEGGQGDDLFDILRPS